MNNEIIIALIGGITTIIASLIAFFKDRKAKEESNNNGLLLKKIELLTHSIENDRENLLENSVKSNILDKLSEFAVFNEIKNSIYRIFDKTRADRFLLLFSLNGTRELKRVSVAFEIHKNPQTSNAIVRYRDVQIDNQYRELINRLEVEGTIDLSREQMTPQILKDFFTIEGMNTIKLTFVERRHLDKQNDIVIFGTIVAEEKEPWSELETAIINSEYEGTLKPIIREFLKLN